MKNIEIVAQEIQQAKEKYGPFNSTHELYAVLAEELDEFFEYVKQKPYTRTDSERAIKLAKRIFEFLVQKGEVVYLETRIAPKIFAHNGMDLAEMNAENIKFIVIIGGDGSILRVSNRTMRRRRISRVGIPVQPESGFFSWSFMMC